MNQTYFGRWEVDVGLAIFHPSINNHPLHKLVAMDQGPPI